MSEIKNLKKDMEAPKPEDIYKGEPSTQAHTLNEKWARVEKEANQKKIELLEKELRRLKDES